jgi:hypothetical protein
MAVQDDLRRLSQLDGIYLGWSVQGTAITSVPSALTSWYKGRVQEANDGTWTFRSVSSDGSVVGFQIGGSSLNWSST